MAFLTNDKLVIVGAAGMIGSNMVQTALMMGLTSNICLYDVFSAEGVAEEMRQSGFGNVNIVATTDVAEAFKDAKYIISSGGAPRKEGMTREDLLKGNCEIAEQLGKNIKTYCPDVKHVVIIFNPADLTGLVTLLYSGLKPSQVTTLAALDSTRLQSALAKKFGVMQSEVKGCATYGGHGEQMAVFGSKVTIDGRKLSDLIGTEEFPEEEWAQMRHDVIQGGAKIIHQGQASADHHGIGNEGPEVPLAHDPVHGGSARKDEADLAQLRRLQGHAADDDPVFGAVVFPAEEQGQHQKTQSCRHRQIPEPFCPLQIPQRPSHGIRHTTFFSACRMAVCRTLRNCSIPNTFLRP